MRLTGSRTYYKSTPPKMPPGLVELIEGLTRDVLKNNPTDIYGFCAGHMQKLLEIRDGPFKRKSLTLEEKIARAQEKVRERAEKRRQKYDNEFLLQQSSGDGPEISNSLNKDTSSLPIQESTAVNTLNIPVHHEQELINSSEVEVSHESGTDHTPDQNPPITNIYQEGTKDNDELKQDIGTEHESKNDSHLVESTNQTNANNCVLDLPVNDTLSDESNVTTYVLDNQNHEDKSIRNHDESEQIAHVDESLKDNDESVVEHTSSLQEFVDVSSEKRLSTPIDTFLVDTGDQKIEDSAQVQSEQITDNEQTEQNSLQTVDFVANDVVKPQSDTVHFQNDIETQKLSDIQESTDYYIINSTNINEHGEFTNNIDSIVNEDITETNTIDISFKESPNVELQDAFVNSDVLESLLETNTDRDIVTLITQESTSDDLNDHSVLKHNHSNAIDTVAEDQIHKGNKESELTIPSHEELMDTQHQNQMNTNNSIENSIIESKKNNNDAINSGHDTSTKLHESRQISNQEASNMNLETAAITIQKVFRTFLFKSRGSTFEDTFSDENDKNKEECDFPIAGSLNERRPHGITRMDTVLQTVKEEKSLSLSTDDSSTLSSAATVIQAHVRGFLVRNKLNSNKTVSTNSLAASNSNEPSLTSLEMDNVENKNKTILNIHIVPEGGNYFSRDESLITSMDLSLDSSPPSSINLHPLGYDVSERRKQLKREDAIQSISPPSNNSGKLSEDVDSVKELLLNYHGVTAEHQEVYIDSVNNDTPEGANVENDEIAHVENAILETNINLNEVNNETDDPEKNIKQKRKPLTKMSSDEMDVVTPYISNEDITTSEIKIMHSGEFHDAVLPTKVSRSDTSVASEFKNVLVYFLLWNHS